MGRREIDTRWCEQIVSTISKDPSADLLSMGFLFISYGYLHLASLPAAAGLRFPSRNHSSTPTVLRSRVIFLAVVLAHLGRDTQAEREIRSLWPIQQ